MRQGDALWQIQHPGSQPRLPVAWGTTAVMKASFRGVGSRVRDSSSFLGTQKWKVKACLQKSAFCPKCCQGGGSREGSYGPEEGSVAGGLRMRQEMKVAGYSGQWGRGDRTPGVLGEATWGSRGWGTFC